VRAETSPIPFALAGAGVRLAGDRWGDGRPPVLLLHGGGQTRHSWDRTAERLAAGGRTAVTYDARGHGQSGWAPDGDYRLDRFVDDLRAVAAVVDAPPVLVGASLGGMTSLVAVGERRVAARGLVLVDIAVRAEPAGIERIHRFLAAAPDGFATLEEAADAVAAYNPHRPRPASPEGLRKNLRRGEDGRWRWHWDPAFLGLSDEARRREPPARLAAAARALEVPVLLVRGGSSDVLSDEGVAHFRGLLPSVEVVDVRGTGHMLVGDDNDVFADALDGFVDRI